MLRYLEDSRYTIISKYNLLLPRSNHPDKLSPWDNKLWTSAGHSASLRWNGSTTVNVHSLFCVSPHRPWLYKKGHYYTRNNFYSARVFLIKLFVLSPWLSVNCSWLLYYFYLLYRVSSPFGLVEINIRLFTRKSKS